MSRHGRCQRSTALDASHPRGGVRHRRGSPCHSLRPSTPRSTSGFPDTAPCATPARPVRRLRRTARTLGRPVGDGLGGGRDAGAAFTKGRPGGCPNWRSASPWCAERRSWPSAPWGWGSATWRAPPVRAMQADETLYLHPGRAASPRRLTDHRRARPAGRGPGGRTTPPTSDPASCECTSAGASPSCGRQRTTGREAAAAPG